MKQQKRSGFTIIEVVLVLAIAGLIFLMVFVALPALQRSQRDTSRKNIYSGLGAAITTYRSNNNGALPINRGDVLCTLARGAGDVQITNTARCNATNDSTKINDKTPVTFNSGGISYSVRLRAVSSTDTAPASGFDRTLNGVQRSGLTTDEVNKIQILTGVRCGTISATGSYTGTVSLTIARNRSVIIGPVESGETVTCLNVD